MALLCLGKRKRKVSLRVAGVEKSQKTKLGSGSWARLLKRVFAIGEDRRLTVERNFKQHHRYELFVFFSPNLAFSYPLHSQKGHH